MDRGFYVRKSNFSTRVEMCLLESTVQRELARMSLKAIKETNIYFFIPYFISGNLEFIQRALKSSKTKIKCLIRHEVKQLTRTTWHRKKMSSFYYKKQHFTLSKYFLSFYTKIVLVNKFLGKHFSTESSKMESQIQLGYICPRSLIILIVRNLRLSTYKMVRSYNVMRIQLIKS